MTSPADIPTFFEITELDNQRTRAGKLYFEFLCISTMSAGIYVLPAGGTDRQEPHHQDEMYFVVRGQGHMRVGSEDHEVRQGSVIFVAAEQEHRFHDIVEELVLLVFFAPAET